MDQRLDRIAGIALALPEAERVDVESWGHPTFRVLARRVES